MINAARSHLEPLTLNHCGICVLCVHLRPKSLFIFVSHFIRVHPRRSASYSPLEILIRFSICVPNAVSLYAFTP
jgi:hypothetical protein